MTVKNLTGYINLQKKVDKHQFIYASKYFCTFFSVYAKFTIDNNTLTSINFFIINYKGRGNFGFYGKSINVVEEHDGVLRIGLKVIPLIGSKEIVSKKLNIDVNKINKVFISGHPLKLLSTDNLVGINTEEYKNIIDQPTNIEGELDRTDDFFNNITTCSKTVLKELAEKNYHPETGIEIKRKTMIAAISNNCRVSLMDVIK